MKKLIIVRHGKSSWDLNRVKDIDRPLTERGISDGYKMAEILLHLGHTPELMISSSACRALHSAVIFHRVFGLAPALLQTDPHLYLAGVDEILNVIYGNDDKNRSLMIFGHNPGFTEIANYLSNMDISNVPTTGVVILEFDANRWIDLDRKLVTNEIFEFPRKN